MTEHQASGAARHISRRNSVDAIRRLLHAWTTLAWNQSRRSLRGPETPVVRAPVRILPTSADRARCVAGIASSVTEIFMKPFLAATTAAFALLLLADPGASSAQPVLKAGSTTAGQPTSGLNPQTKQLEGISVEVLQAIAKDTGLQIEFKPM